MKKTTQELIDGARVLFDALTAAGVKFQVSALMPDGRVIHGWNGTELEVMGLCETVKARHIRESITPPNALAQGREHSERPAGAPG